MESYAGCYKEYGEVIIRVSTMVARTGIQGLLLTVDNFPSFGLLSLTQRRA